MIARTGTLTRSGVTSTYEITSELPDSTALVRHAYDFDPDLVLFAREFVDGDTLRPLCRCEHKSADAAIYCTRAKSALGDAQAEAAMRRAAALPAPEGAHYMRHCGGYWPARNGGACPRCGELGEVFAPEVRLRNSRDRSFTHVTTVEVSVIRALLDAGHTSADAREFGQVEGCVEWGRKPNGIDGLEARLTAKGYRVVREAASRRRSA